MADKNKNNSQNGGDENARNEYYKNMLPEHLANRMSGEADKPQEPETTQASERSVLPDTHPARTGKVDTVKNLPSEAPVKKIIQEQQVARQRLQNVKEKYSRQMMGGEKAKAASDEQSIKAQAQARAKEAGGTIGKEAIKQIRTAEEAPQKIQKSDQGRNRKPLSKREQSEQRAEAKGAPTATTVRKKKPAPEKKIFWTALKQLSGYPDMAFKAIKFLLGG